MRPLIYKMRQLQVDVEDVCDGCESGSHEGIANGMCICPCHAGKYFAVGYTHRRELAREFYDDTERRF